MKEFIIELQGKIKEKYIELFLYYIKGIETGPRIERRMLKFQRKLEKKMKREGIALVALKQPDGCITISFVPEEKWDIEQNKVQQEIIDEMMKEKGDEISPSKEIIPPEQHL